MIPQIVAGIIFVVMFILIVMDKIERHIVTLVCGGLTLILVFGLSMRSLEAALHTLSIGQIFTADFWYSFGQSHESTGGINWATIIFIAGMMIMVEGMAKAGFFKWLCMTIAKLMNYKPVPILIAFMIVSAVLSMFIDSITVILFLSAVTVELSGMVNFNPVPVVLAEIFCANLGGSATMCGDPPNIIIGTSLGYTFMDFLNNTGLVAGIAMIITIIYFYVLFGKKLKSSCAESLDGNPASAAQSRNEIGFVIEDKRRFLLSALIFMMAVILLVTHAQTGFTVALIGVIVTILTLVVAGRQAKDVLSKVDYNTLLFFIGLFIVVGGLEETGVLEIIANFIGKISNGNTILMIVIIIWISGIASALVDNIPFAATMIPVIRSLATIQGADLSVLAWALAIGTDIGGSATPIGASANVVGISLLKQKGHKVTWKQYCIYMIPACLIVLAAGTVIVWIRYL